MQQQVVRRHEHAECAASNLQHLLKQTDADKSEAKPGVLAQRSCTSEITNNLLAHGTATVAVRGFICPNVNHVRMSMLHASHVLDEHLLLFCTC